jgi:preprotein translocase subunit YajC
VAEALPQFLFLGLLIAVFYFLLIRPQKKRVQSHKNLVESVQVGDEIVTIGGMHGRVRSLQEEDFELEIAPGVVVTYVKSAIARRVTPELGEGEEVGRTSEEEQQ